VLLSLSLLTPAFAMQPSRTPEDFFHMGVTNYCRTNIAQARKDVTNGLTLYPNNPWLTNLWELLNQKEQQQQQQQQNQDKDRDKDQQSKDQQQQDQQKQDQQKQDEQKKKEEEQKKKEEEQKAADQQKKNGEEKQGSPDQQKGENQDEKDGEPQAAKMLRMTPQQAMQLLDMLKGDEKNMPFRPILRTNKQQRVFKDW
jgi:outer membrane biosynthesis protein TonB